MATLFNWPDGNPCYCVNNDTAFEYLTGMPVLYIGEGAAHAFDGKAVYWIGEQYLHKYDGGSAVLYCGEG